MNTSNCFISKIEIYSKFIRYMWKMRWTPLTWGTMCVLRRSSLRRPRFQFVSIQWFNHTRRIAFLSFRFPGLILSRVRWNHHLDAFPVENLTNRCFSCFLSRFTRGPNFIYVILCILLRIRFDVIIIFVFSKFCINRFSNLFGNENNKMIFFSIANVYLVKNVYFEANIQGSTNLSVEKINSVTVH